MWPLLGLTFLWPAVCNRVDVKTDSGGDLKGQDPAGGQEEHLRIIDRFLAAHPRNKDGLLQTYGPEQLGGGPCGKCNLRPQCPSGGPDCRHDVYDSALAAIYYTMRGKFGDAKSILDGFSKLLYPRSDHPQAYKNTPSGRPLTLLSAAYRKSGGQPGGKHNHDDAVDTGNNAYAAMAFAHYAAATGERCAATTARDIFAAIRNATKCDDTLGGFMGRLNGEYRSVEHNIDMAALARMLGEDEDYESASHFVSSMFMRWGGHGSDGWYSVGTRGHKRCASAIRKLAGVPTDGAVWSIGANLEHTKHGLSHQASALRMIMGDNSFIRKLNPFKRRGMLTKDKDLIGYKGKGLNKTYHGFKFSNVGNGIQWEITAGGVIAFIEFHRHHGTEMLDVRKVLEKSRESLKRLLKVYGSVPATILGGNIDAWKEGNTSAPHPGGSDTGLGWTYMRYPHVAATCWTGFALIMQADTRYPVNPYGNPFSKPKRTVPDPLPGPHC